MSPVPAPPGSASSPRPFNLFALYERTPLYLRIIIALLLGALVGWRMGPGAGVFKPFSDIILRLLQALATPLIFLAVLHALVRTHIHGRLAGRLAWLLISNTLAAILIGVGVANLVHPGWNAHLAPEPGELGRKPYDIVQDLISKIPVSLVKPFVDNEIIAIILIAVAFGIALRQVRAAQELEGKTGFHVVEALLDTGFSAVMVVLHWIINLVPLAVFGVVARVMGTSGLAGFHSLGRFALAVILALALQLGFYLLRVRLESWVRPLQLLRGGSDALLTAFSTASSTAAMPITYGCMRNKVGVREQSASMGTLVGSNFNNDGTALYEAMAALFIAQVVGNPLPLGKQVVVVFMAVIASVGAAGIPEAGLVTMLAVFSAVHLPVQYIPLLLTVDWFLDRCRTAMNVMGDMTVASILDGKQPEARGTSEAESGEREASEPGPLAAPPSPLTEV